MKKITPHMALIWAETQDEKNPGYEAIRILASALRSALKDTERLDWLAHRGSLWCEDINGKYWQAERTDTPDGVIHSGETPRAAIDAAIRAAGVGEKCPKCQTEYRSPTACTNCLEPRRREVKR